LTDFCKLASHLATVLLPAFEFATEHDEVDAFVEE